MELQESPSRRASTYVRVVSRVPVDHYRMGSLIHRGALSALQRFGGHACWDRLTLARKTFRMRQAVGDSEAPTGGPNMESGVNPARPAPHRHSSGPLQWPAARHLRTKTPRRYPHHRPHGLRGPDVAPGGGRLGRDVPAQAGEKGRAPAAKLARRLRERQERRKASGFSPLVRQARDAQGLQTQALHTQPLTRVPSAEILLLWNVGARAPAADANDLLHIFLIS
jgi:hypothetical protein